MKKLKLLKPWRLPTVRLKLGADTNLPEGYCEPPARRSPCAAERQDGRECRLSTDIRPVTLETCSTPYDPGRRPKAPAGRAIFASTASPHPGCPHLFS